MQHQAISLFELNKSIQMEVHAAFPETYWVIAEISEINENRAGHCYLELIEKHPDEKNVRARVKAIVWNKRYSFLKSFFENTTGESLREGLKILIKAKVEYHELYGLSLIISDIDPAFTIGDMAMKRQLIIKRLEQDGVFSMNKELDFPLVPQKIAVISSKSAAGYTDFLNQLKGNSAGYVFYTALFETIMQGTETEQSVIKSLDLIADRAHLFDLVVIIRGGGSQSDLSWFDSYNIAYHVTQFPLPVVTGIGHEKDLSVTDMVAHNSLKTPTAVADYLIDRLILAESHIAELSSGIIDISRTFIEKSRSRLESSKIKLIPVARVKISVLKNKLAGKIIEVINVGKGIIARSALLPANQESRMISSLQSYYLRKSRELELNKRNLFTLTSNCINNHRKRIEDSENTLFILKPENVMARGYTITTLNGTILKRIDQVNINDDIDTLLCDGTVISRVLQKKSRMGEEEKG